MVRVCRVVPKDWSKFEPLGNVIPRTRFIVFKTPINSQLSTKLRKEQRFNTNDLFRKLAERGQHLGLVVDLTDTDRYYDKEDFEGMCVQYEKVNCPGRGFIDRDDCVETFNQVIQSYTDKCEDQEALIGVHCTNGINRCGYLICRFLIERLGWSSHEAIDAFEQARGCAIEKGAYVMALHKAAKDSRSRRADSDSDSSERKKKKKSKRKHQEEAKSSALNEVNMIHAILGELGHQTASVSGYQSSPNGVATPDAAIQQKQHWGFVAKRSKYAPLNQPVANGTPNDQAAENGSVEEEYAEEEEEYEEIEEEVGPEPGKGQSVSSKRRARRNRMQNYMKVMQRGRFHEIQAMREEVALTHGSNRD